jgi:serine/threonine-protein kinase
MAPEQLLGEPVDGRADLYATGAVLFECVTGQRVMQASDAMALVAYHLKASEPAQDPASLNPEIPPELSRAILRALARKPEDRWQTAAEFLRALEEITPGSSTPR